MFVRLGPGRPVGNTALDHAEYFLLGQIRGHWDYPTPQDSKFGTDKYREVNMGMALITPVTDLLSVLYSDELGRKRQEAEQEITNQKSANS